MTRIQRERFFNEEEYLRLKGTYELNAALLRAAPLIVPASATAVTYFNC